MDISAALIQQFFDRTCTLEEAEAVADYFQSNPHLLEAYFTDEWTEHETEPLTANESMELFEHIHRHVHGRQVRMLWMRVATAIAASVVMLIGSLWLYNLHKAKVNHMQAQTVAPVSPAWQVRRNSTAMALSIRLEDSSVVKLEPGTSIKYRGLATLPIRDIYLTGKGLFKVAKDKTRPFTVYADKLATTAVGTMFDVAEDKEKITINLYEGKVVVKPTVVMATWTQPVYLTPGESLVFNKGSQSFKVKKQAPGVRYPDDNAFTEKDNINSFAAGSRNWYMFNNQPLTNVFSQLEELYHVTIKYNTTDIRNVYFIGRFDKTDSIQAILNNIALLKHLQVQQNENLFIITKKVH